MASNVRIWKFGARAPTSNGDILHEQLRLAGRYYNQLVEIERDRAARFHDIRREYAPDLASLEDEHARLDDRVGELIREAKRSRQQHWQQSGAKTLAVPDAIEAEIKRVKAERDRVSREAKPLRKSFTAERLKRDRDRYKEETKRRANGAGPRTKGRVNAEVLAEMLDDDSTDPAWRAVAASDDRAQRQARQARADSGLTSGTYLVVEAAFDDAKADSSPRPPRFRSHRGDGRVAVQLRGTTVADVLSGSSSMLQLSPDPRPEKRGKSEMYYVARIRVGSEGRDPVWCEVPVKLHRMPPHDAAVKWAWIVVRRRGERLRYELQLTLDHESLGESKRFAGVGDGGHVRIGWGVCDGGVRVARWPDGEVVAPTEVLEGIALSDRVKGFADEHFAEVLDAVFSSEAIEKLRAMADERGMKPLIQSHMRGDKRRVQFRRLCDEWAREHVLGANRLDSLWRQWKRERTRAGRDLFARFHVVEGWMPEATGTERLAFWAWLWTLKDRHLRQWSADQRAKSERRRDAHYRAQAIRLATRYERLSVDKYSIARLKELPELRRSDDGVNERAQSNLQHAAPGRFREILREVMGDRCSPRERSGGDDTPGTARKPANGGEGRSSDAGSPAGVAGTV